jgi:hypothetical protein
MFEVFLRSIRTVMLGGPLDAETRNVAKFIPNENFDSETRKNDIALIKLDVSAGVNVSKVILLS